MLSLIAILAALAAVTLFLFIAVKPQLVLLALGFAFVLIFALLSQRKTGAVSLRRRPFGISAAAALFTVSLLGAGLAAAPCAHAQNTPNYMKQGGAEWHIGGKLIHDAGGYTTLDKGSATANSGNSFTATSNSQAAVITTGSLTTAAGSSQTITLNDSEVTAGSLVLVSQIGGTNSAGTPIISAVPGAGTITVTIANKHATAAFNGTFILGLAVF